MASLAELRRLSRSCLRQECLSVSKCRTKVEKRGGGREGTSQGFSRGLVKRRPQISERGATRVGAAVDDFRVNYPPLNSERFVLDLDGPDRQLIIETGAIGRQANGAVLARQGDTVNDFH